MKKTDPICKQYKDTAYYLTVDGEVYHKLLNGNYRKIKGIVDRDHNKLKRIRISIGNRNITLARMMWETFVGEIPEGYNIEHKNGCSTFNELSNLICVNNKRKKHFCSNNKKTRKIINLKTRAIYRGTREASRKIKHSRQAITNMCNGLPTTIKDISVAWWDDVNGKAFRGNYDKYHAKHMLELEYD